MGFEFIQSKQSAGVLTITMDDPTTRNAIGPEMSEEIGKELDRLQADPDLRVVILTGRDPSFCSGANVKRMGQTIVTEKDDLDPSDVSNGTPWEILDDRWRLKSKEGYPKLDGPREIALRLHRLEKPSIAAVNGYAMGLGMGLSLSCDIRIASEQARFSEAFIRNGLIPADGSSWQLPRLIGIGNTLLLQYTGEMVSADDAYRMGLVNKVVSHDDTMGAATELAQKLAEGPTYSLALIKRLMHKSLAVDFGTSLDLASEAQEIARRTEDHKEGVQAFVEKRKPAFKGR